MTIEKFALPIGRIVSGHPSKPEFKENFQTKQPVLKNGVKVEEWRCKLAIPKDVFNTQVWPQLHAEAATLYPSGVGRDFSWKFVDGDSPECPKGSKIPYNVREGYPGHYVLTISTEAFAPPIFKFENGAYRQITADEIKCGDYVKLNVNIKAHNNNDGGLYLNPNGFELVAYGKEIVFASADPTSLFGVGGQQYQLPAGASLTPVSSAPAGAAMPLPQQPQQYAPAPAPVAYAPQPQQYAPPVAYSNAPLPAPAHDFVQAAVGQPVYAPAPMAQGYQQPMQGVQTGNVAIPAYPFNPAMPGMPVPR